MLQQTQVERVVTKYQEWLRRFPTVERLAQAPQRQVILAWSGLGYNRRALHLQRAARMVMKEYGGRFPRTKEELMRLPGVGVATAGSLLAFAFGKDVTSLDVNIKRVLHRYFVGSEFPDWKKNDRWLEDLGNMAVPEGKGHDWNQAMMDFGSLVCTARRPLCAICPLQKNCRAYPKILIDVKGKRKGWDRVEPGPSSQPEIPNRIFRGRVIEALRQAPRHSLAIRKLAPMVKKDFNEDDARWFDGIIGGLEKDGFITITKKQDTQIVRLL